MEILSSEARKVSRGVKWLKAVVACKFMRHPHRFWKPFGFDRVTGGLRYDGCRDH